MKLGEVLADDQAMVAFHCQAGVFILQECAECLQIMLISPERMDGGIALSTQIQKKALDKLIDHRSIIGLFSRGLF
jgi:hypothetical protein